MYTSDIVPLWYKLGHNAIREPLQPSMEGIVFYVVRDILPTECVGLPVQMSKGGGVKNMVCKTSLA